ncbi:hypothetical protein ACFFK0_03160 [Paenibacillus chartarius]|uniref:Uncharacterized protein n=1 Tax=Paenibacillus chartarius TaxID=747481 RepID=A0ABV6DFN1_9BACL
MTESADSITPSYLMENLLTYMKEENRIEAVVYVARMKDGTITSGWTDMQYTEVIGLLEVGKLQVVKEMWSEWTPQ